jgi:MraZ protein
MFRGISFHTIDPKGRIIIPSRFRDTIRAAGENVLMITRMDGCLYAYTFEEWRQIENRLLAMAEQGENMRRFRRVFIGGAFECPIDKQGRTLIPPVLRQYAKLEKEIALVGVLNHFEIWDQASWEEENRLMEEAMQSEDARNDVARLGL